MKTRMLRYSRHRRHILCAFLIGLALVLIQISGVYAAGPDDPLLNPVTPQAARRAALAWMSLTPDFAEGNYRPAATMIPIREQEQVIAFALPLEPQGFIIVTPYVDLKPILAYSNRSAFNGNDTPDNVLLALIRADIPQRLQALVAGDIDASQRAASRAAWESYLAIVDSQGDIHPALAPTRPQEDVEHGPFLTSQWNQSGDWNSNAVFNYYTPPGPDGNVNNHPSGCVSTALAQVLNYYEWPVTGVGSHSYLWDNGVDISKTLSADFGATSYPWADMLDVYTDTSTPAQRQAAGLVTYHAGVAVNMNYASGGSAGSVASIPGAVNNYFRMAGDYAENPADADFYSRLYNNMLAHRPAVLGVDGPGGGHAVVADGVRHDTGDDDNLTRYYHLNMGWGGMNDAWYDLPDVTGDFNVVDEVALDLIPIAYLNDPGTSTDQPTFPVSWSVSTNQGTCTYDLQQAYVGVALDSIGDGAESGTGNWVIDNNWAVSTGRAHSGAQSFWVQFTDSASLHTLELNRPIRIDATTTINYWWRSDTFYEAYYDGWANARLEISTDGVQWTALATHIEGDTQAWAQVEINSAELAAFHGQMVWLRFTAEYFPPVTWGIWDQMHGFFVDDFALNNVAMGVDWTLVADDVAGLTSDVTIGQSGDYAYRVQDSCSQQWSNVQTIAYTGSTANLPPNAPSTPTPADGATDVATTATLAWSGGDPNGDAVTYTVAFGDANPPPVVDGSVTTASYNPGTLITSTTYYWQITATDGLSITAGPQWSFTTTSGGTSETFIYLPLVLRNHTQI